MKLTYPIELLITEVKKLNEERDNIDTKDNTWNIYHTKKMTQVFEAIRVLQELDNRDE